MSKKNLWWIITPIILTAAVVAAVVLNFQSANNNSTNIEGTITTDNGDLKINWERFPTKDVNLSGSLTITQSGTYHLTGEIDNGSITIKTTDLDGVVKLILDNVTINNDNGPAIACYNGEDLVIELIGENVISDGGPYTTIDDDDVNGAIYSKADLTFQGDGILNLAANYQDAIVSKDDLKFNSGTYNIVASDDGIRGKDSVYIVGGDFTIESGADAIKSTNETDLDKGFVMIENGKFNLASTAKGIKAINSVLIYGGNFIINSGDDAIHSNNYVGITNGELAINSNDDGIHADKQLIIEGGTIDISKSYEGLEAQAVTINGGEVSIVASDDGINAGGGADSSSGNRPGAGAFDTNTDCVIIIGGGNLYINSSGDGIDSNGYVYFNNGTVVVDGPTNNGNGALDAGISISMNGGSVIAVGSSGMAESLGSESNIANVSIFLSDTQPAGTEISIEDASGNTIISHSATKSFSHIAVGSENFVLGESYTLYLDGVKYQYFTLSGITTVIGNSSTMTPPGGSQDMMMSPDNPRRMR